MQGNLATIIPVVAALLAGVGGYFYGRLLEDHKQFATQKINAYADYLKSLAGAAAGADPEKWLSLAIDSKMRVCVFGSSSVLRELANFDRSGAIIRDKKSKEAIENLILNMRHDIGLPSKVGLPEDLRDILFGVQAGKLQ